MNIARTSPWTQGHIAGSAARVLSRRKLRDRAFYAVFLGATLFGIVALAVLLIDVWQKSMGWLDWQFLTSWPSRRAGESGFISAMGGSAWLILLTALFSFPLGIGAAIYLEEYAPKHWLTRFIQTNILNLAGVPSVVYGLLGLAVFVRLMGFGRSVLAGAATMSLLVLPMIIVASQEAIRSVPDSLRHASYALGATRWQTVSRTVVPAAVPGILTGTILAVSRALGETAPLITIGALTYVRFLPRTPLDSFTVMPIQIYSWVGKPQADFAHVAAAGIVVLLAFLLAMNAVAILLRDRFQRRSQL